MFWSTSWCLHFPEWPQFWSQISRKVTLKPGNYTDVQKHHKTVHTKIFTKTWTCIWQRWAMLARRKWKDPFLYHLKHVTGTKTFFFPREVPWRVSRSKFPVLTLQFFLSHTPCSEGSVSLVFSHQTVWDTRPSLPCIFPCPFLGCNLNRTTTGLVQHPACLSPADRELHHTKKQNFPTLLSFRMVGGWGVIP